MILWINGWAATPSIWDAVEPREACLYYDANQSSRPSDLLAAIEQNCPPQEKLTVIGWSMGGLLALELAAARPENQRHGGTGSPQRGSRNSTVPFRCIFPGRMPSAPGTGFSRMRSFAGPFLPPWKPRKKATSGPETEEGISPIPLPG